MLKEESGIYFGDCKMKETSDGFSINCKKGKPAIKIQVEKESKED